MGPGRRAGALEEEDFQTGTEHPDRRTGPVEKVNIRGFPDFVLNDATPICSLILLEVYWGLYGVVTFTIVCGLNPLSLSIGIHAIWNFEG